MRNFSLARRGRLARGFVAIAAVGLSTGSAFAQSQFSGAIGQASGASAQGNVEALQRGLIDTYAIGSFGNISGLGAAAVGGGRVRETSHTGFSVQPRLFPPATVTYGADIKESTKFVSGSIALPGTILGGKMRFGVMLGETTMKVEAKPNSQIALPAAGAIGGATVENTFYGGSALWSGEIGYISAAGIITTGTTEMTDRFLCCVGKVYREMHDGMTGSLVAGRVFPLVGDGLKLDLRGGLGHTKTNGDPFDILAGGPVQRFNTYNYSTASASFSPMLFADMAFGGVKLRPYAQATFKTLFNYNNSSQLSGVGVVDAGTNYTEGKKFRTLEGGLNASYANFLFGAALYHEHSANSSTAGGKLGVSYQF